MKSHILKLVDLSKHFGGLAAVEGVHLNVQRNSITSLIGPNGAGKTTCFNMVTSILSPTRGMVQFFPPGKKEYDITDFQPHQVASLGIARTFQNIKLFRDLTVLENVKLGFHTRTSAGALGALFRLPSARREEKDITTAGLHYLNFVGLADQSHEIADCLAYGAQRRLEIARALASNPKLLLLDEPAAGMNPTETKELMDLIRRIREQGITIFLIEHDMRLVMDISDHIYVLDHGEKISEGSAEEIQNDPKVIEAYLGSGAVGTE